MRRIRSTILTTAFLAISVSLHAQPSRTWVSGFGDDANPCSRTFPCKTFAHAYSVTATHGEINCIDAGAFGTLTIGRSMTIDCLNNEAGILVGAGGNGVTINAGATDEIILRGIDINGTGQSGPAGTYGMRVLGVGPQLLLIDNCTIANVKNDGIDIETTSGTAKVVIRNTRIHDTARAIYCVPNSPAAVNLIADRLRTTNNSSNGLWVSGNAKGVVRDSSFTFEGQGLRVDSSTATLEVYDSIVAYNGWGITSADSAVARIYGCQVSFNSGALLILNGGQVLSHQNNAIRGNSGSETGASGIGAQ